jgi:hypothetical protein
MLNHTHKQASTLAKTCIIVCSTVQRQICSVLNGGLSHSLICPTPPHFFLLVWTLTHSLPLPHPIPHPLSPSNQTFAAYMRQRLAVAKGVDPESVAAKPADDDGEKEDDFGQVKIFLYFSLDM